ncbi:MAG: energy-coupling factor transporter ATPase [Andreesenia angusta]|nr:energy-coupling factor transporter ATPase [Andreesenia angusta]
MIEIKDISFIYPSKDIDSDDYKALDNININIKRGEFVAILGHNGSGKSTLSKLMNGILLPTEGDILVNGMNTKSEEEIWDIRQTAGMVFQNPDNQLVATIVEEDIAFGPENQGIEPSEIRRRVDEALNIVDMYPYRKSAPHALSGGQKQRIAIAGILAMDPDCIILDEPTAMLDPSGRKEVMNTVKRLNLKEKKTIVHITHYMDEVVEADRIIILEKGRIIAEGKPKEIFSQVEKVRKIGLDVPQVTELAYELNKSGIDIDTKVLNIEELVNSL